MTDDKDVVIVKLKTWGAIITGIFVFLGILLPLMFQNGCFDRQPLPEPEPYHEEEPFVPIDEREINIGDNYEQRCRGAGCGDIEVEFDADGNPIRIHKGGPAPEEGEPHGEEDR